MAITSLGGAADAIGSGVSKLFGALRLSSGLAKAAQDANEIHSVLDPIAYDMRTTAVLQTEEGTEIAAGGASHDLTPAQRARAAQLGLQTARMPGAHAEVTALQHALQNGFTPDALAVTRPICPACQAAIESTGGKVVSPTTAIWPD